MRRLQFSLLVVMAVALATAGAESKTTRPYSNYRMSSPAAPAHLPPDLREHLPAPSLSMTVADTFELAWYTFDTGSAADPQGWIAVDPTAQIDTFFHVADATELDGGDFGRLIVLEGNQSMWCGQAPSAAAPFCAYAALPGYGNGWDQTLISKTFDCDSLRICYRVAWDSEPGYDYTRVEYYDGIGDDWIALPVDGGAGLYESDGQLDECFMFSVPAGSTRLRFHFISDGAASDEDGIYFLSDGALIVDSLTIECFNADTLTGTYYEDFEDESPGDHMTTDGCWRATEPQTMGLFADLYPAATILQEDPCVFNNSYVWGFFDDPSITNYACGGHPGQGAIRHGPTPNGFYMHNEIWSPRIPLTGQGSDFRLRFKVYRDLPQDNLIGFGWAIRSWIDNCPKSWQDFSFIYFGTDEKDWFDIEYDVGSLVDAGAEELQIQLRVMDACPFWCSVFGTGNCHSQGPLFDDVRLIRINTTHPEYFVRHLDLFQDNFAEDGTLTGTVRADAANDIKASGDPQILPGDSIVITVSDATSGIAVDPTTGTGAAVYMYAAVWPSGQPGKSGPEIEAPEIRSPVGTRFPLVDSLLHDGTWWYCFRADTLVTNTGFALPNRYCLDLNDNVFTPGDTICYVFCAENIGGERSYWSRRLSGQGDDFVTLDQWEALSSPCEWTCLPAGGWNNGGDILYVDDTDDRGGPVQLYFDTAFQMLGLEHLVDRYDVLAPSSTVGNSLASRAKLSQLLGCYQKIIWSSGDLDRGLLGDGSNSDTDKSDDYTLLFNFLDQHTSNPGVYLTGDNIAEEWAGLSSSGPTVLRGTYMNFNLSGSVPGDHVASGEPVSPCLVASGPCFTHLAVPDSLIAYGGCPSINAFDLLAPTGGSVSEFANPVSGESYILSQTTQNAVGDTARVILSGVSFHDIHSKDLGYPVERVHHLADIIDWLRNTRPDVVGIGDGTPRPEAFLANAYPNPFNPTTTIRFGIRERSHVSLNIYNAAGQLVRTLVDDVREPLAGGYRVDWNGRSSSGDPVASGVYFYKLVTKNFASTKKMVLLK